eukprot:10814468-Alexandrium_andersonii.AAC.1
MSASLVGSEMCIRDSSSTGRPVVSNLDDIGVFTWNVRWLVNPSAAGNNTTRAVICRQLERGRPCFLQETHWDEAAAAIWK